MSAIKIQTSEEFDHLPRAPIIEAVIDIRAASPGDRQPTEFLADLKSRLPDYPISAEQNTFLVSFGFGPGQPPRSEQVDFPKGIQFKSQDGLLIANFKHDGFAFSRLAPYQDWQHLKREALRLWAIYKDLWNPFEISRIGLRYINRINLPTAPTTFDLSDYLAQTPVLPKGLEGGLSGFLHVDTLTTLPYPYAMNVIRAIQPAQPILPAALILDTDVFVLQSVQSPYDEYIDHSLEEMRWLKNKAFFGTISEKLKESFK